MGFDRVSICERVNRVIPCFRQSMETQMSRETLFGDLPEAEPVAREWPGRPRLREPVRDQVELRAVDLDGVAAGPDHPARIIWAYVQKLDLSALEETVRARVHASRASTQSARAYRWRCGCLRPARV